MIRTSKILLGFALLIALFSCKRHLYSDTETVLARVGKEYLYLSDLDDNIPANMSNTDSIQMMNNMVDNWVRQELILQQANINLPDSLKDFSKQLELYKNNLIIYEYKKRIVEYTLDTTISQEEIEEYYQSHSKDFELKENIIQFAFIKIPVQSEYLDQAQEMIQNIADTSVDRSSVEEFCQLNTIDYYLNDEQWVPFNDLLRMIPIEAYNQEIYLKNNRFIKIKDHPYWYFINIRNFKIKEDISPLDFEEKKIRNIILNQRKLQLLNALEEDIYKDASANHQFEIY